MKKVYIETNGCAVLRHETYRIAEYIKANDFEEIDNPNEADYIIFTGCGVTCDYEDFAINTIKNLYDANKNHAKLIVTGCIPSIATKRIKEISNDIVLITNNDMTKDFDAIFYNKRNFDQIHHNIDPKKHHSDTAEYGRLNDETIKDYEFAKGVDKLANKTVGVDQFNYSTAGRYLWQKEDLFEIRVSYGCSGKCSYCATKIAIGEMKSVDEKTILEQAKTAKEMGFNRLMLMGDEIGFWEDNGKNIVDLINDLLKINPDFKIGIRYIYPDILARYYEGFRPLFANGSIYYFCSAFQSGSERILRLMNRNPNLEPFVECMSDIAKNNYPVFRHTQIIVGFPTETDVDVLKTIKALQRCSFDYITITPFSKRKGTKAYELPELPNDVIEERMALLNDWLELNRSSKIYKTLRNEYVEKNGFTKVLK